MNINEPAIQIHKALFLDRDGVLNVDMGYTHQLKDFALINGADDAVALAHAKGYKVFIVTNQGGIALGYFDQVALEAFHDKLLAALKVKGGVITDIAVCPHHPDSDNPMMRDCQCRKPSPKMILDLAAQHQIDLSRSIMVGDKDSDVEAGFAAGCQAFLFEGGRLDKFITPLLEVE
jgi:D-glycero-D-manno-heptose 1,7-bisphosphate phosphatase